MFRSDRLRKICNDERKARAELGMEMAKVLRRRLDALRAAPTLACMRNLPGRCHELTGNLAGVISIDLRGQYRLLFVPMGDPVPTKPDGGLDWTRITKVEVFAVEDTHE